MLSIKFVKVNEGDFKVENIAIQLPCRVEQVVLAHTETHTPVTLTASNQ